MSYQHQTKVAHSIVYNITVSSVPLKHKFYNFKILNILIALMTMNINSNNHSLCYYFVENQFLVLCILLEKLLWLDLRSSSSRFPPRLEILAWYKVYRVLTEYLKDSTIFSPFFLSQSAYHPTSWFPIIGT